MYVIKSFLHVDSLNFFWIPLQKKLPHGTQISGRKIRKRLRQTFEVVGWEIGLTVERCYIKKRTRCQYRLDFILFFRISFYQLIALPELATYAEQIRQQVMLLRYIAMDQIFFSWCRSYDILKGISLPVM